MTLNDIIVSALVQLSRSADAQALDTWRDRFAIFANEAVEDLAYALRISVEESVPFSGGCFLPSSLSREPLIILGASISRDGSTATVRYVPAPKRLSSPTDVPELPEHTHELIVSYVVARERAGGDVSHQRGSDVYFNLYERGKRRLIKLMTGDRLINRY